jgi:O-antigen biosynthesis protein
MILIVLISTNLTPKVTFWYFNFRKVKTDQKQLIFVTEILDMTKSKLLIIGMVFPEPNSSGAGTRMLQLIHLFREQGFDIAFASAASDSEFMFDLTSIKVEKINIKLNDSSFDEIVRKLNPDIVLFDRFITEEQFGWRVSENCPDAIRILETVDLHTLRLARQKNSKENTDFKNQDLYSETAKREIACILRCDLSLVISEVEMEFLTTTFQINPTLLYYLPFLVSKIDDIAISNWKKFEDRKDFIFVGNFLHEPNWNCVLYIKEKIWPILRKKLPEAKMLIYGAYPSQKVLQLHKPQENFMIMGRADNAFEVVENARIVLAPIRFGAGSKTKLLEAMKCGTPSVTTKIGAEGMFGALPWNGKITEKTEEIIEAAFNLYTDKNLWEEAQHNGVLIVNRRFEKSLYENLFYKKITFLIKNLTTQRQQNFIGEILKHHSLLSTKYMSRWIEEKNRK